MKNWFRWPIQVNRASMRHWFVRMVRVNRASIYIVACGVTSLIAIPTAHLVAAGNGWWGLLYVLAINLAVVAIITAALYPLVSKLPKVPKRPARKPATGKLSRFAYKRIREEQPDLLNSPVVFEIRLPWEVLFIPFPVKTRSAQEQREQSKERSSRGRLRKTIRHLEKLAGDSTIITPLIRFVLSLLLLAGASVILLLPDVELGGIEVLLIAGFFTYCLIRFVSLYHRLARWSGYRVIAFRSRETDEYTVPAQLVVINKPRLLPGGSVPAIPIAKIQAPWTSSAPKGASEESKLSILAGTLKLNYILVDIIGEEAGVFESMGPFREAVYFNNQLKAIVAETNNL